MNTDGLVALWRKLTEPAPAITIPDQRSQARLFAALMLIFMPFAAANLLLLLNVTQLTAPLLREPTFVITLIGNLVCWIAYGLSRSRYYQYSIALFTWSITLLIYISIGLDSEHPDTLYWLLIPVLISSLLLPLADSILLVGVQTATTLLLPRWVTDVSDEYALFTTMTIATISSLLLLFANLRQRDLFALHQEQERLQKVSQDLRHIQNELEERIEARTHDLAASNTALREQITEREQAETLLAERNVELSLLNRVLTTITSDLSMEQILTVACQELAQVLRATHCTAALLNADRTISTIVAEYAVGEQGWLGRRFNLAETPLMNRVIETGQPVSLVDIRRSRQHKGEVRELIEAREAISSLLLPLFIQGESTGCIGMSRNRLEPFTQQEIMLGSSVAAAVSQSLYTAHLFHAEREQRTLAEALLDTTRLLADTADPNQLLEHILDNVERVVPHDSASVMLVEDGYCRVVCSHGFPPERESWINQTRFHISTIATLAWMCETHQVCWIPDTHQSELWEMVEGTDHIRSYVGAPMVVEGELIGFLHADNFTPHAFTAAHAEHLQAFANQVALTFHNIRLHEQLAQYTEVLEQKVAERTAALAQANEELRALARVKDEFVANVSHELRTPITNLMLRQALLEKVPEKREKHLAVMRRETQRLNRIIEDLLQLSRLDRGRIELTLAPVDVNDLVAQYVADRLPLAESLGLHLNLGQQLNIPTVLLDEELVGQVLSILLTNALNFTPSGGRIEVRTQQQLVEGHTWVGFSVADSGPGIPPEEQPRLFERFFRGRAAHELGVPGTGLGLALAHEIITRHGGIIEAKSTGQIGEGAMFLVWFPSLDQESLS